MIGYLQGRVIANSEGKMTVGVGDPTQGSIGYSVTIPQTANYDSVFEGDRITLHVHTHVREDALDLFGFLTTLEKDLFLILQGVSGIGPRVALAFLSNAEPSGLIKAILDGDREFLTRIPGVGKKTAERMLIELVDPIRKRVDSGRWAAIGSGAGFTKQSHEQPLNPEVYREAFQALLGLGYSESRIQSLLQQVSSDFKGEARNAEDLVRGALKLLL